MFRLGHIAVVSAILSGVLVLAEAARHGAVAEAVASDKVTTEGTRKAAELETSIEGAVAETNVTCRPTVRVVYPGVSSGRPCSAK